MHLIFLLLHLPGFPQVFGYHELHCHCCLVGGWFLFQDQPFVSLIPKLMSCSFFGRILWRVEKIWAFPKIDGVLNIHGSTFAVKNFGTKPKSSTNNTTLEPKWPLFLKVNPTKGSFGFQDYISPQYPESNMGNPGWSPEMMRFQVRGVETHYFCWVPLQEAFPFFGAAFWQQQRKLNPGKKIGHLFVTLIADIWKSFQNHFAVEIPFISSGFAGLQHAKSAHVE